EFSYGCSISSPGHLAINLATEEKGTQYALEKHRNLVSYYVMSRGTLNGSVRALPGFSDPLVRYSLSAIEMNNLGRGIQGLASLLLSAGAKQVFTGLRALPSVTNSQQLAELPESLAANADNIMTVHQMASCPMGENRRVTAVNSWGRVHGYTGLYVADVSSFCTSPGINPQGTIMALAKRTSEHFLRI
ncbi:MAG: GMC family oxidoreductase, partial [Gammaproteobacteria bacterium]